MGHLKCYNCGGEVLISPGSRIGICSSCMAEIPIPDCDDFDRQDAYAKANTCLSESRFDEALAAFQEILIQSPMEAAACWGMALAQYGIEYVNDPATGEQLPTLHRLSQENFSSYLYAKKAIQYAASLEEEDFYKRQSALIDQIQAHSLQISYKEEPYDIFICYKKTETGEKRTADSRMAADIYRELKQRGYKVFYADESLTVGEEYEPRIFAALHSARVLVALASRAEYYEAVWVRNEWSRYADLIDQEEEKGGSRRLLIPVFRGMTHGQLPEILKKQPVYIEMDGRQNPKQGLLRAIADFFSQGKEEDTSDLRRAAANVRPGQKAGREDSLSVRAAIALASGDFAAAGRQFEELVQKEPSGSAYLGLLMCRLRVPGKEALYRYAGYLRDEELFVQALRCATKEEREEYEKLADVCAENVALERGKQARQAECEDTARAFFQKLQTEKPESLVTEKLRRLNRQMAARSRRQAAWTKHGRFRFAAALFLIWNMLMRGVNELEKMGSTGYRWQSVEEVLTGLAFVVDAFFFYHLFGFVIRKEGKLRAVLKLVAAAAVIIPVENFRLTVVYDNNVGLIASILAAVVYTVWYVSRWVAVRHERRNAVDYEEELKKAAEESKAAWMEKTREQLDAQLAAFRKYYSDSEWKAFRESCCQKLDHYIGQCYSDFLWKNLNTEKE